jgi:hypothetical protein
MVAMPMFVLTGFRTSCAGFAPDLAILWSRAATGERAHYSGGCIMTMFVEASISKTTIADQCTMQVSRLLGIAVLLSSVFLYLACMTGFTPLSGHSIGLIKRY